MVLARSSIASTFYCICYAFRYTNTFHLQPLARLEMSGIQFLNSSVVLPSSATSNKYTQFDGFSYMRLSQKENNAARAQR